MLNGSFDVASEILWLFFGMCIDSSTLQILRFTISKNPVLGIELGTNQSTITIRAYLPPSLLEIILEDAIMRCLLEFRVSPNKLIFFNQYWAEFQKKFVFIWNQKSIGATKLVKSAQRCINIFKFDRKRSN